MVRFKVRCYCSYFHLLPGLVYKLNCQSSSLLWCTCRTVSFSSSCALRSPAPIIFTHLAFLQTHKSSRYNTISSSHTQEINWISGLLEAALLITRPDLAAAAKLTGYHTHTHTHTRSDSAIIIKVSRPRLWDSVQRLSLRRLLQLPVRAARSETRWWLRRHFKI